MIKIQKKGCKNFTILFIIVTAVLFIIAFSFVKSCNSNFGYKAGSGLGTIVDFNNTKYKCEYFEKYLDTFFKKYPQYKPLSGDLAHNMTRGYEFLNLTNIYFAKYPSETYCVQWCGTGFVNIRFIYNYQNNKEYLQNERENLTISVDEKNRIERRFNEEVISKLDSIISKSKDSVTGLLKHSK